MAQAKLDDKTLDSISQELGVTRTTIDSLLKRNFRDFYDCDRNRLQ